MPFWAYILHCHPGLFYTGHTDDLDRRVAQHEAGAIPGFTRDHLPISLAWSQEFVTREEAKRAEKQIKGWSRAKKMALIRGDWDAVSAHARSKGSPSTSSGQTDIDVSGDLLSSLRAEASLAHPNECCGLLLGHETTITAIQPAENVHPAPHTHFEIDPQTLVDAHRAARDGGPQVVGYYHSHPHGPPRPSATDRAQAAHDGRIWAIVGQGGDMAFWRDDEAGFAALSLADTRG